MTEPSTDTTAFTFTTFDALQEEYASRAARANEVHMLRHLLSVLDPQAGDHMLSEAGILRRLQAILATRLREEEATHG